MATVSAAETAIIGTQQVRRERSPFIKALLSLRRNPLAMAGLVILGLWLLIAALAPIVAPYDPNKQDIAHRLQGPNGTHLCGTDELGRDIFSRVLYGARISIPAGILTILVTGTIGIILGAFAGYVGGWSTASSCGRRMSCSPSRRSSSRWRLRRCAAGRVSPRTLRDYPRALAGVCPRDARRGARAQIE